MVHGSKKVFLHPGEYFFGESGFHLHTLLGSCVSIVLWHPQRHIGGMCHFVLPRRLAGCDRPRPDGRYAVEAMDLFRKSVAAYDTELWDYQAKIFGGSNMVESLAKSEEDLIGDKNAAIAFQLLSDAGVEIAVAHVGETGARRLVYDIATGDVWVRHNADDGQRLSSQSGIT